ncbi:MAG TPA: phospholipase D-like domain-containing protein [Steroidobacteraceae bacterium]|nr:phospholipase D-like domain-containing protein [Steroidobacteraceae bacterium]
MTVYALHRRGAHAARWLATVDEAYAEMARLIDAAVHSVRLETYLLREQGPAVALREALLRARTRGVAVWVLLDAFGSEGVHREFLAPLGEAGAAVAHFNPQRLLRRSFRNHRKLLACDGGHAIVGGFNVGPEYAGDGVTHGWCDTGVYLAGPVVHQLEASFDAMFRLAPFTPPALNHFRRIVRRGLAPVPHEDAPVQLLLAGPGTRGRLLRHRLGADLARAHDVAIASAYFLPSRGFRRLLYRAAWRGQARLLLTGRSDVPVARLAAERLYGRLLTRGVRIFEYQPQILHAKLVLADDVAWVGSANLDWRSLHINYELLLRFRWPELVADARRWYEQALGEAEQLHYSGWRARRGQWRRVLSWLAYWLLARLDPLVARRGARSIH